MFTVSNSGWAASALIILVAGCATTGGLSSAAERLERNAYAMSEDVNGSVNRPHGRFGDSFSRDAQALAHEARDFRRIVERRRGDEELQDAFRQLSARYHALRDEAGGVSKGGDAHRAFDAVTEAYLDIEREMRRDRRRYAAD